MSLLNLCKAQAIEEYSGLFFFLYLFFGYPPGGSTYTTGVELREKFSTMSSRLFQCCEERKEKFR